MLTHGFGKGTMNIDLNGATVLVTGGSGGIGEAIARSLADSNAAVALHYNRNRIAAERLVTQLGERAACFQADLSLPAQAFSLFQNVIERYGAVDVLVNNAGVFEPSPVTEAGGAWLEDWDRTIAINLTSAGMLCHGAINHFKTRGGGRIIHIASRAAFRGETEDYLAYAASKGGLVSLSRSIARSFGAYNITSFVIAPGYVRTGMTEEYLDAHEHDIIKHELSLKQLTAPGDIAPAVTFIAAGLMDHATGCTIDINAGSYMR